MALLTCPDCGGKVSDAAPACPHCGRPTQQSSHYEAVHSNEVAGKRALQANKRISEEDVSRQLEDVSDSQIKAEEHPRKGKKKSAVVFVSILVILAGLVGAVLGYEWYDFKEKWSDWAHHIAEEYSRAATNGSCSGINVSVENISSVLLSEWWAGKDLLSELRVCELPPYTQRPCRFPVKGDEDVNWGTWRLLMMMNSFPVKGDCEAIRSQLSGKEPIAFPRY